MRPPLLLLGPAAAGLAPRLFLSGYLPLGLDGEGGLTPLTPEAQARPEAQPRPAAAATAATVAAADAAAAVAGRQRVGPAPDPVPDPVIALVVLSPAEGWRIAALRARWGAVPILLGIEQDTLEGRSLTLASGADDFWLSGLGTSDLLTRLRLHLQISASASASMPDPPQHAVADLRLDPASRQVRRGERSLALTAREYQLLLLLLQHRGEVLSREQILSSVWPDQQGSASNVIEVYVRYLRQKLEQGGERRLIHTVRGRGYCLSDAGPPSAAT